MIGVSEWDFIERLAERNQYWKQVLDFVCKQNICIEETYRKRQVIDRYKGCDNLRDLYLMQMNFKAARRSEFDEIIGKLQSEHSRLLDLVKEKREKQSDMKKIALRNYLVDTFKESHAKVNEYKVYDFLKRKQDSTSEGEYLRFCEHVNTRSIVSIDIDTALECALKLLKSLTLISVDLQKSGELMISDFIFKYGRSPISLQKAIICTKKGISYEHTFIPLNEEPKKIGELALPFVHEVVYPQDLINKYIAVLTSTKNTALEYQSRFESLKREIEQFQFPNDHICPVLTTIKIDHLYNALKCYAMTKYVKIEFPLCNEDPSHDLSECHEEMEKALSEVKEFLRDLNKLSVPKHHLFRLQSLL